MKNSDLTKKIKELRLRKGISQEQLALETGLNLRTIQRIECGESEPRGHSINVLASALNTSPNELIDWVVTKDKQYLMTLNLSSLGFLLFPLLGIFIPLILWFLKKDRIKSINMLGKKLINFQISWCILLLFFYASIMVIQTYGLSPISMEDNQLSILGLGIGELFLLGVPFLSYIYNFVLVLYNTYCIYSDRPIFYNPALKIFK